MKKHLLLLLTGASLLGRLALGQATPLAIPLPSLPLRSDELVIVNVNVVDLDLEEVRPNHAVVIRDGIIISVGKWVPAGRGIPHLNGKGLYLLPGLWDGRAYALATAATERVALPLYLARGVTSLSETSLARPAAEVAATRQALESGQRLGPRLHPMATVLDGPPAGPLPRTATRPQGQAWALGQLQAGDWCCLQVGPNLPHEAYMGVAIVAQEAHVLLVGPVPETLMLSEALAAGQRGYEGLDKLLLACSTQEAGLVAERAACLAGPQSASRLAACIQGQQKALIASFSPTRCAVLAAALAEARAFVVPMLLAQAAQGPVLRAGSSPDSLLRFVPAEVRQQWASRMARQRPPSAAMLARGLVLDSLKRLLMKELQQHRVRIVAGSDAGSATPGLYAGYSLEQEVEALVAAGLSPVQALRAATIAPAIAARRGYELGRIEPGYIADLVLLRADPLVDIRNLRRVEAVVLGGRVLGRAALAALTAEAAQAAQPVAAPLPTVSRASPVLPNR
jgi:hypothetical protein